MFSWLNQPLLRIKLEDHPTYDWDINLPVAIGGVIAIGKVSSDIQCLPRGLLPHDLQHDLRGMVQAKGLWACMLLPHQVQVTK